MTHSLISAIIKTVKENKHSSRQGVDQEEKDMAEYMVSEARGNNVYTNNCIYIPNNYPEEWRKRLEAGEAVSYEEDGEQCQIWLETEDLEEL